MLAAWWLVRTRERRARRREIRSTFEEVERALASAAPAREAAPAIIAAMRRLAVVAGVDLATSAAALERLETQSFDPAAAGREIEAAVIDELRIAARAWSRGVRRPAVSATAVAALTLGVAAIPAPEVGPAASPTGPPASVAADPLDEARALYATALTETDRQRRVRRFAAAERAFRPLAAAHPDAPHLQTDWGNAALGAADAGHAVLAYRRALRAMPDSDRARANLAWLRDRMPAWLPRPVATGALDSLLFWRGRMTASQLHLVAAGAFAIGSMALAVWLLTGRRGLRTLAGPVLLVWVAAAASAWTARPRAGDAVVVADDVTLRSADSAGAAPTFSHPLPAGTEVMIVEARDAWMRITLADGTAGWLAAGAVERVGAGQGQRTPAR